MKHEWKTVQVLVGENSSRELIYTTGWICERCGGRANYREWASYGTPTEQDRNVHGTPADCDESLCREILNE